MSKISSTTTQIAQVESRMTPKRASGDLSAIEIGAAIDNNKTIGESQAQIRIAEGNILKNNALKADLQAQLDMLTKMHQELAEASQLSDTGDAAKNAGTAIIAKYNPVNLTAKDVNGSTTVKTKDVDFANAKKAANKAEVEQSVKDLEVMLKTIAADINKIDVVNQTLTQNIKINEGKLEGATSQNDSILSTDLIKVQQEKQQLLAQAKIIDALGMSKAQSENEKISNVVRHIQNN